MGPLVAPRWVHFACRLPASELRKVQRVLGVPRASMGSLSEAPRVFDPALVEGLLGELVAELKPMAHDARLDQVRGILTLVDGTYLTALPALARWALWQEAKRDKRAAKAHVQFEVLKGVPVAATITDAHASDPDVLEQGSVLRIVTDLMDLGPEVIGLVYQCRWQIEIFFRMFKHLLGCRHLLSCCEDGIRLQTYAAILACLLIALWTGRKPTVRTYEMFSYYLTGLAEEDELLAHIAGLASQSAQA